MLRRNMPSAECQISGSKGRYLVFTLPFFQIPMMTTQHLSTRMIGKKPKNARNCESWVRTESQSGRDDDANSGTPSSGLLIVAHHAMAECCQKGLLIRRGGWIQQVLVTSKSWKRRM